MKKLRGELKQDALLDGGHRYCGVAAAVVGGAIIGGVASNAAANKQAKSQDRVAEISDKNFQISRKDQLDQLAVQRADGAPYREAGYKALSQLNNGLTPGGEFNRNFTMADFTADPGYAFRISQGEDGINRAAIAGGSRYSGATLKDLTRFNSNLGSQEFGAAYSRYKSDLGDRFNRLSGVAGTGQTAVTQAGQAGQNAYGNIMNAGNMNAAAQGNAVTNAAAARASGYVGAANAFTGAAGQLVNNYQQQQYLSQMNQGLNYTPPPDYGTGMGGRSGDFSTNAQEYGV